MVDTKPGQIVVTTHGKLEQLLSGRKPIDLTGLKCLVLDEADVFFLDDKNHDSIKKISNNKHIKANENLQWILFSATFTTEDASRYEIVQERQSTLVPKASQIKIQAEKLKLDHIKQFEYKCEQGKKLDFLKEVFETCESTQTFIFVNSKDYAERVHKMLRKANFHSFIMFSKMSKEERDKTIQQFRNQEINVLITTNLIARGIDVPET